MFDNLFHMLGSGGTALTLSGVLFLVMVVVTFGGRPAAR
jgi:hypothetical protein